ncbi:MAG: hypothetical protein ACMUHU_02930 [Thermoplasmatota archaeon]
MKFGSFKWMLLVPALIMPIFLVAVAPAVEAATVVVDNTMITNNPEVPLHSDEFNVTVEPVLIDAEPVEDGVVLLWSLCTENGCGISKPMVMTEIANGTWSATIGPFQEKEPGTDLDYIDILFRVKITAVPIGGGDEIIEESESITVYFGSETDDDDDVTDDDTTDDDDDDSPFGLELVFLGALLVLGYAVYKKRH